MKRLAAVLIVWLMGAGVGLAGLHYKARTHQEGAKANKQQMSMSVEAWVEGENAKIVFEQSGNPFMKTGTYLLTTDGGETLYLVNPKDRTYSEWDLNAIFELAGNLMQGMGPMFNFRFENPEVETLLEEDGGVIHGFPTTHRRFRTTYTMHMKIMGMKRSQHHESVQDIWSTDDIDHEAFGVWLQREPPTMGDSGLKELIEAEMSKVKGFPLKTIDQTTTTGKKGRQAVTRTITEVLELEQTEVDPRLFKISDEFQRVDMMPTAAAGEDEEQQGLGGLFGRRRRDG